MRAASEATLVRAEDALHDVLGAGGSDAMRVAEDLFGLADLLVNDVRLRRALTDPARTAQDKARLAREAFGDAVRPETLGLVDLLVGGHWTDPMDLRRALETLGIHAVMEDALGRGRLKVVEDEIFEVSLLLAGNRELRNRISDLGTGTPHDRADLAERIFAPHVSVWTMRLLRRGVGRTPHGRLLATLRRMAEVAARLQDRTLVTVTAASEMTPEQVERLRGIVARRLGTDVTVNVAVDPSLVGGFRVRSGTTAVDSSVSTQVERLRRTLVR